MGGNTQELEVKTVPFLGAELIAARDMDGTVWAGVSYICNGVGFTKHQKDRQVSIVQTDEVLRAGCLKFEAGVFDLNNETIALKLDFIPLWLAKINITPKMRSEHPEVADRLKQYQLKAKDVLAAAFLPSQGQQEDDFALVSRALLIVNKRAQEQAIRIEALETQIEAEKPLTEFARSVSDCSDTVTVGEYAKMLFDRDGIDIGRNRLYRWLREYEYLSEKNEPYQVYVTDGLFVVKLAYSSGNAYPVTLITGKGMVKLFPKISEWWNKHHPDTKKHMSLELDEINRYILDAKANGYTERRMAGEIGTISNVAVHKRINKLRKAGWLNN